MDFVKKECSAESQKRFRYIDAPSETEPRLGILPLYLADPRGRVADRCALVAYIAPAREDRLC
ncbi:hypothetical protein [Mesorhizobium australicum]|uniref:hypothetical protein n=1 Tax=Mesorhizobium australicum TaxID=536018 RepID=UPI00333928FA